MGFEPTDAFTSPVFKTGAFNHSAISPCVQKHIQLRRRTHFTTLRPGCQWISALRVKKVCRTTIHLGQLNKKGMRNRVSCVKVKLPHQTFRKETIFLMSKSITQDMAYRQSLMKYAEKYGVSRASRKYNKSRSYIYFWKQRWDGSVASLACQSRRPHSHPNQHTEAELKLIRDMRRRNPSLGMIELWHRLRQRGYTRCPESLFRVMRKMGLFPAEKPKNTYKPKRYEQMTRPGERVQVDVKVVPRKCIADPELRLFQYTAIDEFTRLRFLAAYPEQSTYSSADFLRRLRAWYARRGIEVECVQTDNGFEFTNRFSNSKRDLPTLFEKTAAELGIRHKLIRPYTPRHNGKVERSHREDQKRFYSCHSFYSLDDFAKQLAAHNRRANNLPMRPLRWLSPNEFAVQYV